MLVHFYWNEQYCTQCLYFWEFSRGRDTAANAASGEKYVWKKERWKVRWCEGKKSKLNLKSKKGNNVSKSGKIKKRCMWSTYQRGESMSGPFRPIYVHIDLWLSNSHSFMILPVGHLPLSYRPLRTPGQQSSKKAALSPRQASSTTSLHQYTVWLWKQVCSEIVFSTWSGQAFLFTRHMAGLHLVGLFTEHKGAELFS